MILSLIYLPILAAISWFYRSHKHRSIIHAINLIFFLIPLAFNDEGAVFCLFIGSFWIAWGMSWNLKHGKTFFFTGTAICVIALIFFTTLAAQDSKGQTISIYALIGAVFPPLFAIFSILFRIGEYTGNKKHYPGT